MTNEPARYSLYLSLVDALGQAHADTMMNLLPPTDSLRAEMAELRTELRGEMADLRTELRGEMVELRTDIHKDMMSLRGDLNRDMMSLRGDMNRGMVSLREEMVGLREDMTQLVNRWTMAMIAIFVTLMVTDLFFA